MCFIGQDAVITCFILSTRLDYGIDHTIIIVTMCILWANNYQIKYQSPVPQFLNTIHGCNLPFLDGSLGSARCYGWKSFFLCVVGGIKVECRWYTSIATCVFVLVLLAVSCHHQLVTLVFEAIVSGSSVSWGGFDSSSAVEVVLGRFSFRLNYLSHHLLLSETFRPCPR